MRKFFRVPEFILALIVALSSTACSQQSARDENPKKSSFNIKSLAKSDIDDVLDIHVREMRGYLRELMVKLYKRNPRELGKSKYQDINQNIDRVFNQVHNWKYEELNKRKSIDAIYLVFDENFEGDRVFAFIVGLTSMVMSSYGYKDDFYMLDTVDPQKLYNSARNIEIAVWKLENNLDLKGELFLYSNSLPGEPANLSYERLFGKLIATQDTMATIIAGKTRRGIKKVIQQMATAVFLPI
ncbi:MAG: hypothetical protein A2993_02580 [Gammaproteobacteria bacterium RIFCSPLOWO2_01_FULL_47_190]|nr:MAG: hypothetical protein A2993_02580 [Gammaproteobacteria bacterium RIFCSPLOWO2_01_FULL_47_190]OGT73092.1 MAG: hypothetical protein A2W76_09305 [Gammaproteobacteria bacterium RIFCSPLOWO2_12_47_11]OGT86815.1 MAG: hypothetical protein A3G42_05275 [Gammaproteobacteria bacterium RIFCSPLOWO2_12_FULL_47_76]